jgi:hypothetical protein
VEAQRRSSPRPSVVTSRALRRPKSSISAARRRAHEAGLDQLIEFVHADAGDFLPGNERYDAAICLGASFIWGGLPGTLAALASAVQESGWIAVGEPYWRTWPLPERAEPDEGEDFLPLPDTIERFHEAGLEGMTLIDASSDDWDRYESLHWLAAEEWLAKHADEPDAEEVRILTQRFRDRYLRWQRELLGWAIIVGRKR